MVHAILQGGLGNQLFILANLIAYSKRHGFEYCAPTEVVNPHYPLSPEQKPYRFPGVKYCEDDNLWGIGYVTKYKEPFFHYQEIPLLNPRHTVFEGYFQSYKFFDDYRGEVLKAFGLDDIVTMPDTCSIHYRAGDYKKYSEHHPVITKEYIQSAIGNMMLFGYKKFLVFSDEITEIRSILEDIGFFMGMFAFSTSLDPLYELRLMASCSSQIIANSTFGWWASYINPNPDKKIIAPRNWFGPASAHNDTKDLYIPGTIIL